MIISYIYGIIWRYVSLYAVIHYTVDRVFFLAL